MRPNVQVAILAGGLGSRLRSVVKDRNKVAAGVNGRPFISLILDQLNSSGLNQVVVCSGHKGEDLFARLGNQHKDIKLRYSKEDEPLGTAGALRLAFPLFTTETIIVMNGDSYVDLNLNDLIAHHRNVGAKATIASVWAHEAGRYGKLKIDSSSKVNAFLEKGNDQRAGYINAGVYAVQKSLIHAIPEKIPVSLEYDIFPQWIQEGLYAYCHAGAFIDIGTPEAYVQAQTYFKEKMENDDKKV